MVTINRNVEPVLQGPSESTATNKEEQQQTQPENVPNQETLQELQTENVPNLMMFGILRKFLKEPKQ